MERYQPPFTISDEMLMLTGDISEKTGRISTINEMNARPRLRRANRIRSIHSSLAIEANSLSLEQVSAVLDGRTVLGPQEDILEVRNAYDAYEKIPEIDPYSEKDLLRTHRMMTHGLVRESGIYRSGEEGVFSGDRCIFYAPPPARVPVLMGELFAWLDEKEDVLHPLILSSIFHYEFVFIHPFADSNGRMARLWQTVLLYRWNEIFQYIPLESRIQSFQQGYYDAIEQCNNRGDSDAFILFMLHRIDEILDEVLRDDPAKRRDEGSRVERLTRSMSIGMEYSASELMDMVGVRSRKTLREKYLRPALDLGLIEMTVPDRPRSRNQRYRLRRGE